MTGPLPFGTLSSRVTELGAPSPRLPLMVPNATVDDHQSVLFSGQVEQSVQDVCLPVCPVNNV